MDANGPASVRPTPGATRRVSGFYHPSTWGNEAAQDGYLAASVPELKGCHTQARSMDDLLERVKEAIQLCLEVERRNDGNF